MATADSNLNFNSPNDERGLDSNPDIETGSGEGNESQSGGTGGSSGGGGGSGTTYSIGKVAITFKTDKKGYTAKVGNLTTQISNNIGTNSISIRSLNGTLAEVRKEKYTPDVTYRLTYIEPSNKSGGGTSGGGGSDPSELDDNINSDIQVK